MPGGFAEVGVLADFASLIEQSNAAGMSIEAFSGKVVTSARSASRAMADFMKAQGASADEAQAAAAKTAAAWDTTYGKLSKGARDAGNAAKSTAALYKASADEQTAAFAKAAEAQSALEAQQKAAADAAQAAAAKATAAAKEQAAAQAAAAKKSADAVAAAGKGLASLGKWTLFGGTVGIAASVKGAMDLQTAMERLHTQAGVTQGTVKQLTGSVLNMAGSLATSPTALAQSLYHVESGGIHGADALKVMATAAKEAKVSGADLTDTTTALTATVYSGIAGAQNYAKAMGLLNATVGAGDMTFQDLNEALGGPMLATVKGYGLSLKDVGAALATFGDDNIRGADAATQLRMAVQYMAKPAATAGPILQQLGLSTSSFANAMSKGGLLPALDLLNEKLKAAGVPKNDYAQVISDIFSKKGASGITILENSLTKLQTKYQDVGKGAGQVNQDWFAWNKTLQADIDHLKATVQSLADKFGTALIPKLEAGAHALSDVVHWFEKNKAAAEILAGIVTGVLAGAVTGFAVQQAAKFIGGLQNMARGVQYLAGLLPGLGASAGTTAAEVGAAGDAMVADADTTAAGVDAALTSTGIGAVMVGLGVAAAEMATHWKSVMSAMKEAVHYFVGAAETDLNALIGVLNDVIGLFNSTIGQLTGTIGKVGTVSVDSAFSGIRSAQSLEGKTETRSGVVSAPSQTGMTLSKPWMRAAHGISALSSGEQTNAAAIMAALTRGGLSTAGAAAVTGNWVQESGLNPSEPGGLLAQWGGSRLTNEESYAKSHGQYLNSIKAETGFALQELKGYPQLLSQLQSGSLGAKQLALMVSQQYERPSAQYANNPRRERLAGDIFGAYKGVSGSGNRDTAAATSAIPAGVAAMLATAKALVGTRYTYGGGHNGWDPVAELKKIGIDCSGFVSQVLHSGGVSLPGPLTTTGLAQNLKPGVGKQGVTVYDRATGPYADQHTLIDIMGRYFESGGNPKYNPSGGVSQLTSAQFRGELSGGGFKAFHPNNIPGGSASLLSLIQNLGSGAKLPIALQYEAEKSRATQLQDQATKAQAVGQAQVTLLQAINQQLQDKGAAVVQKLADLQKLRSDVGGSSAMTKMTNAIFGSPAQWATHNWAAANPVLARAVSPNGRGGAAAYASLIAPPGITASSSSGSIEAAQKVIGRGPGGAAEVQALKDLQQLIDDKSTGLVTGMKDQQAITDQSSAIQVAAIKNQTQVIQDVSAIQVATIQGMATRIADAANAAATLIGDNAQTQADRISERGLYGLSLVAQKLQVAADENKASWDAQIATAQQQLDADQQAANVANAQAQLATDQVTATQDANVLAAQQNLNMVTLRENAVVAKAQQHLDIVTLKQDALQAKALAHLDMVTLRQDARANSAKAHLDATTISQDARILKATQHADAVQLSVDTTKIGPAQTAVDLNANSSKTVQNEMEANLKLATAQGDVQINQAQLALANVTANANQTIAGAQNAYQSVQNSANTAIQSAQDQYATAQNAANKAIQGATDQYNTAQDTANQMIQAATDTYQSQQDAANAAIAGAQQTQAQTAASWAQQLASDQANLSNLQGQAATSEAAASGAVTTEQATASTQFNGSGLTVQVFGVPMDNAAAIGAEASWAIRSAGVAV